MSGFDLILSAALCLTCTQPPDSGLGNSTQLTTGLVLNGSGDGTRSEINVNATIVETGLEHAPFDTVKTVLSKQEQLQELRTWINGQHLRIATLEDFPLSYTVMEDGIRVGRGVSFEVIDFLREKFNFTYEVIVPDANIIGSTNDYTGSLIEMLNQTNADLAAAFVPLLSDPCQYIYYSATILDEGEWIMVMRRPSESATGSGLMAPFDFWVWILIFVSLVAVGPIIYLLIILRNKLTGDGEQRPYSLGHCAWFVYGALMKQGSTLSPIADSTRLLFATWWIFITILTSFYTANLTAFLTLSKFTLPFNSVDDILTKNKHFVSVRGGGVEYAIRTTNESLSILNRMVHNNYAVFSQATNDTYNLQNFVDGNGYVFVRDRPAINHVLYLDYRYRRQVSQDNEKAHCPFAMAKAPFLKKKRSFLYPMGSNLSKIFDPELLNLVESGVIKHLSLKNLPNAEICPQDLGGTERQLRNGDLMMTYYIMMAGFATSIVVFTSELIFRFINGRQDANKWTRHGIGRAPNGVLFAPSRWNRNNSGNDKQQLVSQSNVTPPPPYQDIFNSKKNSKAEIFNNGGQYNMWRRATNNAGFLVGSGVMLGGYGQGSQGQSSESSGVRRTINGRDYMVFRNSNGQSQLVPMRVPSATLFQYSYAE